jgi:hypothetical protein
MILDALRTLGVAKPEGHVIIGSQQGWGLTLVKKTPFTQAEEEKVLRYFREHNVEPIVAPFWHKENTDEYDQFLAAFKAGPAEEKQFIDSYWADISVITDDSPFFYKYYRFDPFSRLNPHPASGDTAFYVQFLILAQTVVLILLFILLPLWVFKREGLRLPWKVRGPFLAYFAAIGLGFILIEIALMQKLTLLVGSPIYSISVTLASLLVSSGVGSLLQGRWHERGKSDLQLIGWASFSVVLFLMLFVGFGDGLVKMAVAAPFWARVMLACLMQVPIGICLGTFFPAGLSDAGARGPSVVAWAWGINFGFTVLGSTLVVLIAQFLGFQVVFFIAAVLYVAAASAFGALKRASA